MIEACFLAFVIAFFLGCTLTAIIFLLMIAGSDYLQERKKRKDNDS